MNDLEYRFSEIVTTIELLPEDSDEWSDENLVIPNGSAGFTEELAKALICQSTQMNDNWRNRFYLSLMQSTMKGVMERHEILEQDLIAFALCANLAWISSVGDGIMKALGALSASAEASGLEIPQLAYAFFQDPNFASESLKHRDPISFLGGE